MAGRNPKVNIEQEHYHETKKHKEDRENNTPVYQSQEFKPPETLTDAELKVWEWLVKIFKGTSNCRVSDADVQLMELYCKAKVSADIADKKIKKDPSPYILVDSGEDKDGNVKKIVKTNPYYKIRQDNSALCIKFFNELGLSPLARARAGLKAANSKSEDDEFESLINRPDDK